MRVLLTSTGLETPEIQEYLIEMIGQDMASKRALFIPTAAIDADAIAVLPKCMNDLLRCGIPQENITVFDLHCGVDAAALQQFDLVYLCGGRTQYLLDRINNTGFRTALLEYIRNDGVVVGVSAGSIIFADNLPNSLHLIDCKLDVHCVQGDPLGKVTFPIKKKMRLTNSRALALRRIPEEVELIGR